MARAVETVGVYGTSHPTARHRVDDWLKIMNPLLRSRGRIVLGTDGQTAFIGGTQYSTNNPVIIGMLRRLYTTRAGRLELLSGFHTQDALLIASFLAGADVQRLAGEEESLEAWIKRKRIHHVQISRLEFREVKEGDRVISGDKLRGTGRSGKRSAAREPAPPPDPRQAEAWAKDFREEAERGEALPREARADIAARLRGRQAAAPDEAASQHLLKAAESIEAFADLVLKSAIVQQEVERRADEPLGNDVVACLRNAVQALDGAMAGNEDTGKERWERLSEVLDQLKQAILQHLETLSLAVPQDAEIVRAGVYEIQHDLDGAALKQEYQARRGALKEAEERLRSFFKLSRDKPVASVVETER